jgi:hypothetical protein
MAEELKQPTPEQCEQNAYLGVSTRGQKLFACWYPQMGGYVSRCVVAFWPDKEPNKEEDDCFEAYVWHDGDFPFHGDELPARLHHCSAEQFVAFGEAVRKMRQESPK